MNKLHEVQIEKGCLILDGKEIFAPQNGCAEDILLQIYAFLGIDYPKFFKMDSLSRTAFLASEALLSPCLRTWEADSKTAVILYTSSSSLDTDRAFQKSIEKENYFPSPSLFTYTLANLASGEICIRNRFMGENISFVTEGFPLQECLNTVSLLFETGKAERCLCGFINHDNGLASAHLFMYTR